MKTLFLFILLSTSIFAQNYEIRSFNTIRDSTGVIEKTIEVVNLDNGDSFTYGFHGVDLSLTKDQLIDKIKILLKQAYPKSIIEKKKDTKTIIKDESKIRFKVKK